MLCRNEACHFEETIPIFLQVSGWTKNKSFRTGDHGNHVRSTVVMSGGGGDSPFTESALDAFFTLGFKLNEIRFGSRKGRQIFAHKRPFVFRGMAFFSGDTELPIIVWKIGIQSHEVGAMGVFRPSFKSPIVVAGRSVGVQAFRHPIERH